MTFLLFTDLQITHTMSLNHTYHTNMSNIYDMTCIFFYCKNTYKHSTRPYTDVSGGNVNILVGHSIGHSK
jgi:hypothetical protein